MAEGLFSRPPVKLSKQQVDNYYELMGDVEITDNEGNILGRGPDAALASQLMSEFSIDRPDLFPDGYVGFKKSQLSPNFREHPLYEALSASPAYEGKRLTDVDIINLFARDEEGKLFEEGTFFGGMRREAFPSIFSMAGAAGGAKLASEAVSGVSPRSIPTLLLRAGAPIGGFIVGGLLGYKTGEETAELALGPERPVSPGTRIQYEMGKTAMSGLGWTAAPFLLNPKINMGGAEYLFNLARTKPLLQSKTPIIVSQKTGIAQVGKDQPLGSLGTQYKFRLEGDTFVPSFAGKRSIIDKGPKTARFISFMEKMLSETGKAARRSPVTVGAAEVGSIATATLGTGIAEENYPNQALPRLAYEFLFSLPGGYAGVATEKGVQAYSAAKAGIEEAGGIKGVFKLFQASRRSAGVNRIIEILEQAGYSEAQIDEIAKQLADPSIGKDLIDEKTGKPIEMTAGLKTQDPAMMIIEAAVSQNSLDLTGQRTQASDQAKMMIKNQINALILSAAGGDKLLNSKALQEVSRITYGLYQSGMAARLANATDNILKSYQKVKGENPIDQGELGQKLFEVVDRQLGFARSQEKKLWSQVPEININTFYNKKGEVISQPNFITTWNSILPKRPEFREEVEDAFPAFTKFVNNETQKFVPTASATDASTPSSAQKKVTTALSKITGTPFEDRFNNLMTEIANLPIEEQVNRLRQSANSQRGRFSGKRDKDYANLLDAQAELLAPIRAQSAEIPSISLQELQEARQNLLNRGRKFMSEGNESDARIAYAVADAILDDISGIDGYANGAYQAARSYSRALNDTFTRTFAGDITGTKKTGAQRIAPEVLADRYLAGGVNALKMRTDQLLELPKFLQRSGVEDLDVLELKGVEGPFSGDDELKTITGVMVDIIRNARAASYKDEILPDGRKVKRINKESLSKWIEQHEPILGQDGFASLKRDLQDSEKAEILFKHIEKNNKRFQDRLNEQKMFQNLLPQSVESPIHAIDNAFANKGKNVYSRLNKLVNLTNNKNLTPEQKAQAKEGLLSVVLEWSKTGSGMTGGGYDGRTMYQNLFGPMPGSLSGKQSLMDFLEFKNIIDEPRKKRMKKFLTDLARIEVASVNGNLVEIAQKMGPLVDFYVSIAGSAVGTRAYGVLFGGQGPGSISAAARGQRFADEILNKVPEGLKMDVMAELMQNPILLGKLMRKPKTEREKSALLSDIKNSFIELGFIRPVRRQASGVIRETEEEIDQQTFTPPVAEETQPVPAQPVAPPTTQVAPAISAPIQQSAVQGPVDRSRYAALFPTDIASGMIRQQGIGSLMG